MITVSGGGSLTSPPGGHSGSSRGGATGNSHQQQCTGITSLSGNCGSGTQSQSGTSVGTYHTFNDKLRSVIIRRSRISSKAFAGLGPGFIK